MEQRLIDANALFSAIEEMEIIGTMDNENDAAISQSKVLDMVFATTTIDAVQVVRCGECKHRKQPTDYCEKLLKAYVPDDFYCFYGKRKDGAE